MPYLLGLDVGTTGCKAALFDSRGAVVASQTCEYPLHHPHPGWAEQNPEDWWNGTVNAIRGVLASSRKPADEIVGIGLSGQMHGAVLLDVDRRPVRPAIIWSDGRTTAQCREITKRVGAERLIELTGNPALEGFTAPKVLWVRDTEPDVFDRVSLLLLPKDYVRFRLTGEIFTDVSDAAGTCLFDVRHTRWSDEVLERLDLDPALLPEVRGSSELCGSVTRDAASGTGLEVGTPVVAGGADNACGAIGTGVVRAGLALVSIGTSGVVLAHSPEVRIEPGGRVHTFNHAVPDTYYLMGVTQGAGFSLRWLREILAIEAATGDAAYDAMTAEAEQIPPLAQGIVFLPYLQGERTPHMDARARGVFFGLTGVHTRGHLTRAVLEGVAFSLRDSLAILQEQGLAITDVRVTGGGARSALWLHILADVLGVPLARTSATEGPAFGAALLAGVGSGMYGSIPEACDATIRVLDRTDPDAELQRRYQQGYDVYHSLYPLLKESFRRVAAWS